MKLKKRISSLFGLSNSKRQEVVFKYEFGSPLPPPNEIKHKTIFEYAGVSGIDTLVETGTYLGTTISAALPFFTKIFSIEVQKDLALQAREKFKTEQKVTIIEGDSAGELSILLRRLDQRAVFWLDGHYSGGITGKGEKNTPIINELKAILAHKIKDHVILIDDARCFIGEYDYPTLFEIYEMVKAVDKNYQVNVKDDIIRIVYAV